MVFNNGPQSVAAECYDVTGRAIFDLFSTKRSPLIILLHYASGRGLCVTRILGRLGKDERREIPQGVPVGEQPTHKNDGIGGTVLISAVYQRASICSFMPAYHFVV